MNSADNNVIESKSILLSILAYGDNEVIESRTLETPVGRAAGLSVSLVRLADSGFAVCDKSSESYFTYIFDGKRHDSENEDDARFCYEHIVEQIEDAEKMQAENDSESTEDRENDLAAQRLSDDHEAELHEEMLARTGGGS